MKINKKFLFIVLPVFIGILVLDLLTKEFIAGQIALNGSHVFIPGLINFTYVENDGAAWNIFAGDRTFLIIITVAFVLLLGLFYFFERKNGSLFHIGLAMILGGAVGNMVDRIFIGIVRDFIQFDFWKSFPVFNVADAALTIGVVLVVIYYIFSLFKRKKNAGKNWDFDKRCREKSGYFS